jgi:WXG100 family type VII secretion target
MAAVIRIVHASHDELPKFAKTFGRESDRVKSTIDRLDRVIQVLEGGDWIGEGATTFFKEMRSVVMPALVRLMKALEMGGTVTQQINRIIEEIEQSSMGFFAAILVAFEGGAAGKGGGLGAPAGVGADGGESGSASTSGKETPAGGGGSGGGGGGSGGGGGGGGGGGSWDGEIGFRQEKTAPGAGGSAATEAGRRRSGS